MSAIDYSAWIKAEAAIVEAEAAIAASSGADEVVRPLVDRWWKAQVALCQLEPQNIAQAVRQIEMALKDGELAGVDAWAIVDRAKALAGDPAPQANVEPEL